MKQSAYSLLTAVVALLFLSSCASTNSLERRVAKYPQSYQQMSEADKRLVGSRQIREGMSKDAVYFSWGSPSRRSEGSSGGTHRETWYYTSYKTSIASNFGFSYGRGYGGYGYPRYGRGYYGGRGRYGRGYYPHDYGFYGGPEIIYRPYTAAAVNFTNGKVSSWESVKR